MQNKRTVVMVLRSGGDFSFKDVSLLVYHIHGEWEGKDKSHVILLWDKASQEYELGNIHIIPLNNSYEKWWSRMMLYSPEMEQYRPFMYIDLDTLLVTSLEYFFDLITPELEGQFITLEDLYQPGKLATGFTWVPAKSKDISRIWEYWNQLDQKVIEGRMDYMLRRAILSPIFWQSLTNRIIDAKPRTGVLKTLPAEAGIVCFHGHPRIYEAENIPWVNTYIQKRYFAKKVTVVIPYKVDRGWLKECIASIPDGVQVLVSQGEGNWPENFNKSLPLATGDYIKFLHEDDMLTPNSIEDSIKCFEETGADFIHGNAIELYMDSIQQRQYIPENKIPTLAELMQHNSLHCPTLMYKREVFEKLGGLDEILNTAEEFEFNLRCLQAGFKIGYCNSFLAIYRRHSAQKIRVVSTEEKRAEKQMVINKYK